MYRHTLEELGIWTATEGVRTLELEATGAGTPDKKGIAGSKNGVEKLCVTKPTLGRQRAIGPSNETNHLAKRRNTKDASMTMRTTDLSLAIGTQTLVSKGCAVRMILCPQTHGS